MLLVFYFYGKILLANTVDPDHTPHYLASDLGKHCLPMTLLLVSKFSFIDNSIVHLKHQELKFTGPFLLEQQPYFNGSNTFGIMKICSKQE